MVGRMATRAQKTARRNVMPSASRVLVPADGGLDVTFPIPPLHAPAEDVFDVVRAEVAVGHNDGGGGEIAPIVAQ